MPDFNPDKEAHAEHKFVVQNATRRPMENVPNFPDLKFNNQGRLRLTDEGQAREIQQMTKDVTVTRLRHPSRSDRGHVYFFGQFPGLPWAKYDELGRRIDEDAD